MVSFDFPIETKKMRFEFLLEGRKEKKASCLSNKIS